MKKKLILLNSIAVVLAFSAAFLFSAFQVQQRYHEMFSQRVSTALSVLSAEEDKILQDPQEIAQEVGEQLSENGDEMRITIISSDGQVLGDSTQKEISENHANRPEVKAAKEFGRGTDTRMSATVHQSYYYEAISLQSGVILRAALPTTQIDQEILGLWKTAAFSIALGVLMVLFITGAMVSHATRPLQELTKAAGKIAKGEYSSRVKVTEKDEVGDLASSFNKMAESTQQAMEAQRHNQNQLEGLLDSMDSGVLAIDREDKVQFLNERARELVGIPHLAVGGQMEGSLLLAHIGHLMHRAMESGEAVRQELSGQKEEQKLTVYAVRVDDGHTALAVISDVTRMKQLEQLRTEFVSNVTHELKTPLTAIRGSIELLKSADRDEKTRAYFYDVLDMETQRLQHLIDDMLALSQIENAKEDPSAKMCSVEQAVKEVVERLSETAKQNEVQLSYHVDPKAIVRFSPTRLQQMISNLVENAIKYNRKGGTVSVDGLLRRNMVVINVKDTGIGIAPEHIGRLFERFYRVDASRSREIGGTGLGLSIVKHLAVLYGGTVSVESVPEKGSTFTVTLPIAK